MYIYIYIGFLKMKIYFSATQNSKKIFLESKLGLLYTLVNYPNKWVNILLELQINFFFNI